MPTKYESILITYAKRNFYFVSSLSFNLMITNKFTLINDLYIISEIQPSVATWPRTSRAIIRPTVITPKIFLKREYDKY